MKKLFFTIFCFIFIMNNVLCLEVNSTNYVVYNLDENKVILEKGKDEIISIASLTKIMTTIVAIENIKDLDETVTIQTRDFVTLYEEDASLAGFKVGQVVTYRDLLYGTFLPSGAEATQALAFNLAGSIENFVQMMNDKVKELGLKNTKFANTTGLDNENNYSTVEDVATILKYALNNDTFKEIYKATDYIVSDNSMILGSSFRYTAKKYNYDVSYVIGAKTGYTDDAGRCLASTGFDKKNSINYLIVTCGADTTYDDMYHIKDNVILYNYLFDNYKKQSIFKKEDLLVSIRSKYGKDKYTNIYATNDILVYLNNNYDINKISTNYEGIKEISYNTPKGKIGKLDIFYDNELINTTDIILDKEYHFSLINYLIQTNILYILIALLLTLIIIIKFGYKKRLLNK